MTDESEMAERLAAALDLPPDKEPAEVTETARKIACDIIRAADETDVPLEFALTVYAATCGELWAEIKRRAAGRKS